jgi:hypothetical protein
MLKDITLPIFPLMREAHKVVQDERVAAGWVWLALAPTTITLAAVPTLLSVTSRLGSSAIAGGNGSAGGCLGSRHRSGCGQSCLRNDEGALYQIELVSMIVSSLARMVARKTHNYSRPKLGI